MEFFDTMEPLLRTFWYVAIPTTLIFAIQTIMTFTGIDSTDGIEADFDSDLQGAEAPFQLFSIRNLINFLIGFSWAGISLFNTISSPALLIIIAFVVGCIFLFLFFWIIRQVQKLAEDNSFKLTQTLNKTAEVYLSIPAHKTGKGKISLSINGSYRELDAITENEKINTGTMVRIIQISNDNILVVESI